MAGRAQATHCKRRREGRGSDGDRVFCLPVQWVCSGREGLETSWVRTEELKREREREKRRGEERFFQSGNRTGRKRTHEKKSHSQSCSYAQLSTRQLHSCLTLGQWIPRQTATSETQLPVCLSHSTYSTLSILALFYSRVCPLESCVPFGHGWLLWPYYYNSVTWFTA